MAPLNHRKKRLALIGFTLALCGLLSLLFYTKIGRSEKEEFKAQFETAAQQQAGHLDKELRTKEYWRQYTPHGAERILGISIFITLLLAGYLYLVMERSEHIERIVERRTSELVREIEERRKAEESLKSSEGHLRKTKDALHSTNRALREMNLKLRENRDLLIQAEKMVELGQISAGVAHEINNPMGYLKSNLVTLNRYWNRIIPFIENFQILFRQTEGKETADFKTMRQKIREIYDYMACEDLSYIIGDVPNLLTECRDGLGRVTEIVQGLRNFARPDEGELSLVDINQSLEETLKIVGNELKYKCNIQKDLHEIPVVPCYPRQIQQVFMNLLINAAQAIPQRGEIRIETGSSDSEVFVKITDNGVGIQKQNLSRVFTPFFTTKPVGKGIGLGLSISYAIVQKHQGTIDVASEEGLGTTFTIRLPIQEAYHA